MSAQIFQIGGLVVTQIVTVIQFQLTVYELKN